MSFFKGNHFGLRKEQTGTMREKFMWYVIQVRTGTEEKICIQCKKTIPKSIMEHCFIPHYEEKRKIQGKWKTLQHVLFPGYVFVITNEIDKLRDKLKSVIGMTRLIGSGDDVVPLTDQEIALLLSFGGDKQLIEMSEGIIIGDMIIINSGPLKGKEGYIRKINRHKRKAWLEIPFFGSMQTVQVGLEIVEKR